MSCCDHSAGKIKPPVNEEETKELWCRMIDSRRIWSDFGIWITAWISCEKLLHLTISLWRCLCGFCPADLRWPCAVITSHSGPELSPNRKSELQMSERGARGSSVILWHICHVLGCRTEWRKWRRGLWKDLTDLNPIRRGRVSSAAVAEALKQLNLRAGSESASQIWKLHVAT